MSAISATLAPEEGAELLRALSRSYATPREQNEARWTDTRRDVVLAFERQPVLVAGDGRSAQPGPDGKGVLVAFTDSEAQEAYARDRHGAAPALGAVLSSDLAQASRSGWIQLLETAGAAMITVNPAGPLGAVLNLQELRMFRPRLLRGRSAGNGHNAWLDVGERAAERARARSLLDAYLAAARAGDDQAVAGLKPELETINRIESLLTAAEMQYINGLRWRSHDDERQGLAATAFAGVAWARFGDPYRGVDALIEVAQAALGLLARDRGSADWARPRLDESLQVISALSLPYRGADVTDLEARKAELEESG